MTEFHKNLIYDMHNAMSQYIDTALAAKNERALLLLATRRRQDIEYGDPQRCEALQKEAELNCLDEKLQKKIEQALFQQVQIERYDKDAVKLLQQFKATLKLDISNPDTMAAHIQSKVNAYEPEWDPDASISETYDHLQQQKRAYSDELEKIYNSYTIKSGLAVDLVEKPNAVGQPDSMDVALVYEDDTGLPVAHGQVIYWEYPAGQDMLDTSDINNLLICLAETDHRGVINRCAAYPDGIEQEQGWSRGYIVEDNKITIASVAGEGVLPGVSPVLTSDAQYKTRKFVFDRMQERFPTTPYEARKYEYRPQALGEQLQQRLDKNGKRFSLPIKFRPGMTYGFFVCPLHFGHLETIDLNEMVKTKIGESSIITVQKLPDTTEGHVQIIIHSTLREWNRRLLTECKTLTQLLEQKRNYVSVHNKNVSTLHVLGKLSHWHRHNAAAIQGAQQNAIQRGLNDELNRLLQDINTEYQEVINLDAEPLQIAATACADSIIGMLTHAQFAKELGDHIRHVKAHVEDNPLSGPYMKSDPGCFNIFETLDHCLITLYCSERSEMAFAAIGLPYLQSMVNADDAVYRFDEEDIDKQLKTANREHGMSRIEMADRRKFFDETHVKLKINTELPALEYLQDFFEKNGRPVIAMSNNVPGPNSVLQSVAYSTGHLAQFFVKHIPAETLTNTHALQRRVELSVMHRLVEFASKGLDQSSVYYNKFETIWNRYKTNPLGGSDRGSYAQQLIIEITDKADISSKYWYRSVCQFLGIIYSAGEMWRSLQAHVQNQHDPDAGLLFLQVAVPNILNFTYVGVNSSILVAKMRRDSLFNKLLAKALSEESSNELVTQLKISKTIIKDGASLANKLGHLIALYSTIVNVKLSIEHYGLGRPGKAAEYLLDALSIITMSYGALLGFAGPMVVAIGVALTIALLIYRRVMHNDFEQIVTEYQDNLEALWIRPDGRDLRPWSLRDNMKRAATLITQLEWGKLHWTTIVPLHELGFPPAAIASIASSDSRCDYSDALGKRKNITNINELLQYYQRLQTILDNGLEKDKDRLKTIRKILLSLKTARPMVKYYQALPGMLQFNNNQGHRTPTLESVDRPRNRQNLLQPTSI